MGCSDRQIPKARFLLGGKGVSFPASRPYFGVIGDSEWLCCAKGVAPAEEREADGELGIIPALWRQR